MTEKLLTVFVDASFYAAGNRAGYGAWAKREGWERGMTWGAKLTGEVHSAFQAELLGLVKAVGHAKLCGWLEGIEAICLQSDCVNALAGICANLGEAAPAKKAPGGISVPRKYRLTAVECDWVYRLKPVLDGRIIWCRHVYGHQTEGSRSWVNNKCDSIAKEYAA